MFCLLHVYFCCITVFLFLLLSNVCCTQFVLCLQLALGLLSQQVNKLELRGYYYHWNMDVYHKFDCIVSFILSFGRTHRLCACMFVCAVRLFNITLKYKNTNHQQMHKESFIINRNTLLHVSTLLGHLQGELFVTVTLGLHFTVEWECAADCVLEAWTLCGPSLQAGTADSSRLQKQRSTQSTAHSHSTIKMQP
jgi:hypothetical protein